MNELLHVVEHHALAARTSLLRLRRIRRPPSRRLPREVDVASNPRAPLREPLGPLERHRELRVLVLLDVAGHLGEDALVRLDLGLVERVLKPHQFPLLLPRVSPETASGPFGLGGCLLLLLRRLREVVVLNLGDVKLFLPQLLPSLLLWFVELGRRLLGNLRRGHEL